MPRQGEIDWENGEENRGKEWQKGRE